MSQDRMPSFKNYEKDTDELRRPHNDESASLRKQRQDEQLVKQPNIDADELDGQNSGILTESQQNKPSFEKEDSVTESIMKMIVAEMFSNDPATQLHGTTVARKILSRERHPNIDVVVSSRIAARCVEFVQLKDKPDLQFEALWVLTNIASGTSEHTEVVVNSGALQHFIELLRSPNSDLVEQSILTLGHCIEIRAQIRDKIIFMGVIPPLVALVKTHKQQSVLSSLAWTLAKICRGKSPPPPADAARQCLPALARLIAMTDYETVSEGCWALSFLSEGNEGRIQEVIDAGVVQRLSQLLLSKRFMVMFPSLLTLGNIVTGNDSQTQAVVKCGIIPTLVRLLGNRKATIVKESAWTLSNITAGTVDQITTVMKAGAVEPLIHVIQTGDFESQKEALWAITNITTGGNVNHMIELCDAGVLPVLCDSLTLKDWRAILIVLEAIENILRSAAQVGQIERVLMLVEECGGIDKIESLQSHENFTVYTKAYSIIVTYFYDPEYDGEQLLPARANNGEFEMNVQSAPEGGFDL